MDKIREILEGLVARTENGLPNEYIKRLVNDAEAAIRAEMPRWICVKERLPEEQDEVLVYCDRNVCVDHLARDRFTEGFPLIWYLGGDGVTHWMPLPAAPQKEEL